MLYRLDYEVVLLFGYYKLGLVYIDDIFSKNPVNDLG